MAVSPRRQRRGVGSALALAGRDIGELPESPEQPPLEILAYAAHPYTVKIESKRPRESDIRDPQLGMSPRARYESTVARRVSSIP